MGHKHGTGQGEQPRDDLTGEHRIGDAGQIVFAVLFFAVWVLDLIYGKTTYLNQYVPFAVRIAVGAIVIVFSGWLAKKSLSIVFGETRKTPQVIRKSVFGIVRHPVYLSEIILYVGVWIISMSLAAAAVCLSAFCFLHYISKHEEKLLLKRFGEEYEKYMREVPMWIPRLKK